MTQIELSDALGISYQQVQKYESGKNRIGASRLQTIAQILGVPVSFFFGEQAGIPRLSGVGVADPAAALSTFIMSDEGVELNSAFFNIADARLRRSILIMVKSVAAADGYTEVAGGLPASPPR